MNLVCGIDEAGRGPVIGPLVMAGVLVSRFKLRRLKELGVKDSKVLTRKKREELFPQILNLVQGWHVEIIHPSVIDAALRNKVMNLNWLEACTGATIVEVLRPGKVILDCPSVNIRAFHDYFVARLHEKGIQNTQVLAEHRADKTHVVVSAASILAKVIRDREIDILKKHTGHDFGSGYLTDEKTQLFLKNSAHLYQDIFRKSWITYKRMELDRAQKMLGEF